MVGTELGLQHSCSCGTGLGTGMGRVLGWRLGQTPWGPSQSGEVQPLVTRLMERSVIPNISITGCPSPQQWGEGDEDDSGRALVCFV